MESIEQAINTLLDLSAGDLVRFAWGKDGFTFVKALPPLSVWDGLLEIHHLCRVKRKTEAGLVHLEMPTALDPKLPDRFYTHGTGAHCETNLPVLSTLYWLVKGHTPPTSPYEIWVGKRLTLRWSFRIIEVPAIPASALLSAELPGLLPLVPFTQDANAQIVETARRMIPNGGPPKQADLLESLLMFFWSHVKAPPPELSSLLTSATGNL